MFAWIEQTGAVNRNSNAWLVAQIALQLVVVGIAAYAIRLFIIGAMEVYSSHSNINDAKIVSLIYAVIIFIGQDHLKGRLSRLNQIMDRV